MGGNVVWSYLLLKEEYSAIELENNFPGFLDKHLNETQKKLVKKYYLQPLKDIHLRSSTDPYTEIEPENPGYRTVCCFRRIRHRNLDYYAADEFHAKHKPRIQ
jgi:hypothetical protein